MKSLLQMPRGKISLTADCWLSKIYNGYMIVTGHWIDVNWNMYSMTLEFKRFHTPHTGDAVRDFLYSVISEWKLSTNMQFITTDKAADMCSGVLKLFQKLNDDFDDHFPSMDQFHVRCIAHVVNLSVKSCMKSVHSVVDNIRSEISALRYSTKRRDKFESVAKELQVNCDIPNLDCETRWSSTFIMIKNAYKCRKVM